MNDPDVPQRFDCDTQADQALARLDMVIERLPDDPEARFRRGQAYLALKQYPEALADLALAAEKLPARPDVLYTLALAHEGQDNRPGALRIAERALRLAPESTDVRVLTERLRR